jgi:hypothetical protein
MLMEELDDDVPEIDVFEHRRHKNNYQKWWLLL